MIPIRPASAELKYFDALRGATAGTSFAHLQSVLAGTPRGSPTDAGLLELQQAFRATGGLARGDDLARLLDDQCNGDADPLAQLIDSRQVFGFARQYSVWVPMFQFELHDLSVKPAPGQVLAALGNGIDDWTTACWFVRPNPWLARRRPLDLLHGELPEVLSAARIERRLHAR